ncbi:hypothetical protein BDZ97DRAFT_1776283 [Flammula alnicola]|nr:hypothetical protein BDZ97DRAFT_1776283 [Flammula alnicola]
MQFKRLGDMAHISGPLKLMWNRISFSRLTLIYFCFSVAHFVIQLSFQIKAFTINAEASSFFSRIVNVAQTTNDSLPFLRGDILRMCSWVPSNLDLDVASCPVVWNGTAVSGNDATSNAIGIKLPDSISSSPTVLSTVAISSSSAAASSVTSISTSTTVSSSSVYNSSASPTSTVGGSSTAVRPQTITVFVLPHSTAAVGSGPLGGATTDLDGDGDTGVDIDGDEGGSGTGQTEGFKLKNIRRDVQITASPKGQPVSVTLVGLNGTNPAVLDGSCLWSLNWPVSVLDNTKREDMVFIGFQVWVLGMSIVALLNESIPHIIASLATHMIASAWATFQIYRTASFRSDFNRVITNGACKGVSLLPHYWDARAKAEIPSLALNVLALLVSSFLTWKLIKLFGWQTFKRVGASLTINRVYKFVLFLSITIQLSLFFMIVTVSLWVDQLMNSVIGDLASFQKLYKVTSLITLALLVPWLMTGWFAVRRELKVAMLVFLLLSLLYLGAWGVMFISTTFRWTFVTWEFFAIMASASVFLTVLSVILGIICGLNFGKGLARYLNAQQPLDDRDSASFYDGQDIEKVAFPSSEKPLPTYASFDEQDPRLAQAGYSGYTLGPRFSNKSAEPFESAAAMAYPAPVLSRNLNDDHLHRNTSYSSTTSSGSSTNSHVRTDSDNSRVGQKRWIIE